MSWYATISHNQLQTCFSWRVGSRTLWFHLPMYLRLFYSDTIHANDLCMFWSRFLTHYITIFCDTSIRHTLRLQTITDIALSTAVRLLMTNLRATKISHASIWFQVISVYNGSQQMFSHSVQDSWACSHHDSFPGTWPKVVACSIRTKTGKRCCRKWYCQCAATE